MTSEVSREVKVRKIAGVSDAIYCQVLQVIFIRELSSSLILALNYFFKITYAGQLYEVATIEVRSTSR